MRRGRSSSRWPIWATSRSRNRRPSSSNRYLFSNTEACSKFAIAATDLNDWMNRLSCGKSRYSAIAQGPASTARPPRTASSCQKQSADLKTALISSGASNEISSGSPPAGAWATTLLVVPKSSPSTALAALMSIATSKAAVPRTSARLWRWQPVLCKRAEVRHETGIAVEWRELPARRRYRATGLP